MFEKLEDRIRKLINEENSKLATSLKEQVEELSKRLDSVPFTMCWYCGEGITKDAGRINYRGRDFHPGKCFKEYERLLESPDANTNYWYKDGFPIRGYNLNKEDVYGREDHQNLKLKRVDALDALDRKLKVAAKDFHKKNFEEKKKAMKETVDRETGLKISDGTGLTFSCPYCDNEYVKNGSNILSALSVYELLQR